MTKELYFEDLSVGQTFETATVTITSDQIKEFAAQFDPQSFHQDELAARSSLFGGLVASGWHTAGLSMRLLIESEFRIAGGLIGGSVDQLKWPRPVRPGDTLRVHSEILEMRVSQSKPTRGSIKMRVTTLNQSGQPVLEQVVNLIVPRRPE